MLELCADLDLAGEPLCAERGGELWAKNLYCYLAAMLQIIGEIHRGHAALTQFTDDGVMVGEGGLELREQIRRLDSAI
jgi:hypothetical protein